MKLEVTMFVDKNSVRSFSGSIKLTLREVPVVVAFLISGRGAPAISTCIPLMVDCREKETAHFAPLWELNERYKLL